MLHFPHAQPRDPHHCAPPETARRLAALAAEEGGSPETLAAEAVADMVNLAFDDGPERLRLTEAELRASVEAQMREIEAQARR